MRKHIAQLAHNTIRRNHRLVRLEPIRQSLVDVQHMRAVRSARPNHLRRHRLRNILLLKSSTACSRRPCAASSANAACSSRSRVISCFSSAFCCARVPQVNVVVPHARAYAGSIPCVEPLHRRHQRHRPAPQQRHLPAVRSASRRQRLPQAAAPARPGQPPAPAR